MTPKMEKTMETTKETTMQTTMQTTMETTMEMTMEKTLRMTITFRLKELKVQSAMTKGMMSSSKHATMGTITPVNCRMTATTLSKTENLIARRMDKTGTAVILPKSV